MGAGSLSDILQCLWKAKIRLKKAGNDWTDLLVVNVMASLVYDLEGFQPPAFWMRGWRADSLLYLTPCNFPTTCRVPAGEKGAQGPPPPAPRQSRPAVPCAGGARAATQRGEDSWFSSSGRATRQDRELLQCPQMSFLLQSRAEWKLFPILIP